MHDVLIVGGGLAGSLAAWRLATVRPDWQIQVVDAGRQLGGNHTWSFHDTDVTPAVADWLAPLVVARWPRHEVRFPGGRRELPGGYQSISSERLHAVVAPALGTRLRLSTRAVHVEPSCVHLDTGDRLDARLVIDARGDLPSGIQAGWQTFVGLDLELTDDHGLDRPVLMDATVPQTGGFRFIYVLPWSERRLLVEDTLYADGPEVDEPACERAIRDYVARQGWTIAAITRRERGALPIPMSGSAEAFWSGDVVRIGVGSGLFHPTTGYSLPDAASTADFLTTLDLRDGRGVYLQMRERAVRTWRHRRFFRLLNRLLFRAAEPDQRCRVLEQFYQRPDDVIERFYAARLTLVDILRILSGRPPVPLTRALAHLRSR